MDILIVAPWRPPGLQQVKLGPLTVYFRNYSARGLKSIAVDFAFVPMDASDEVKELVELRARAKDNGRIFYY
jgi:hypothetical protein